MPKASEPLRTAENSSYTHVYLGVTYNTYGPPINSVITAGTSSQAGSSNPNWRKQVARKEDASTNYTRILYSGNPCVSYCKARTPSGGTTQYALTSQLSIAMGKETASVDSALKDIALSRIKKKLSGIIGNQDLVVPVVELRELRKSIVGCTNLVIKTLDTLVDIKRTKGLSALKYASEAWLTFSFGVKPLLGDIKSSNDAISAWLTRQDTSIRVSGSASKAWREVYVSDNELGAYRTIKRTDVTVLKKLSYRYSGSFDLRLKSGNNYGVDDHFGLEVGALPSIAWELTPFSWAVDYFTTVGAYLNDTFVLPPGSLKYLVLNSRLVSTVEVRSKFRPADSGTIIDTQYSVPGVLHYTNFTREKLVSLPHLSLRLKGLKEITGSDPDSLLGINAESTMNKMLNLASVLVGSAVGYKPDLPPKFRPPKWQNRHLLG